MPQLILEMYNMYDEITKTVIWWQQNLGPEWVFFAEVTSVANNFHFPFHILLSECSLIIIPLCEALDASASHKKPDDNCSGEPTLYFKPHTITSLSVGVTLRTRALEKLHYNLAD